MSKWKHLVGKMVSSPSRNPFTGSPIFDHKQMWLGYIKRVRRRGTSSRRYYLVQWTHVPSGVRPYVDWVRPDQVTVLTDEDAALLVLGR